MLADDGLMDERDYETYYSLFTTMSRFMQRPDVIVYLDVTPERSMDRIRMRNRDVESGISLEYLQALYAEYESFIDDISRTVPVIRVDYDRFRSAEEMAEVIEREYLHSNFVREVTWKPTAG